MTGDDMQKELTELKVAIARIEAKLDSHNDTMSLAMTTMLAKHTDHEHRLRKAERGLWSLSGIGIALAALGSYVTFWKG